MRGISVRIVVISVLMLVNLILESTVFQNLRIYGVKPDFSVVLIVAYAILRGSSYGAFIGLGAGMLVDSMYGRIFGINSFSYMITGYIIGQVHENVFKDSFVPPLIFNFLAILIYQHIFFLLSYFTNSIPGTDITYLQILLKVVIPQAIYNSIVGTILYRYLYKLDARPFMDKKIY